MHRAGYVHADLKPANFLFELGDIKEATNNVYIVDFGLSRKFIDEKGNHLPIKSNQGIRGTLPFISMNTHSGIRMSRRDDIESLAYVTMYLVKGTLPWISQENIEKQKKYAATLSKKRSLNLK